MSPKIYTQEFKDAVVKYYERNHIKISDNVHSLPILGDTEVCAVNNTPFKRIPQLPKRGEDSEESLPPFVSE